MTTISILIMTMVMNNLDFYGLVFSLTNTVTVMYGDFPVLLVEEDLRCPSMYYFRHKRAPEQFQPLTFLS